MDETTNAIDTQTTVVGMDFIGSELFELKVSIEELHSLDQLLLVKELGSNGSNDKHKQQPSYWLSYRCFGEIIQSDKFSIIALDDQSTTSTESPTTISTTSKFVPTTHTFRVKIEDLISYFNDTKNNNFTLKIHLCTDNNVIATAAVDMSSFVTFEKAEMRDEYSFKSRLKKDVVEKTSCSGGDDARVAVRLCIDRSSAVRNAIEEAGQQPRHQQQQQQRQSKSAAIQTTTDLDPPSPTPSRSQQVKESTSNAVDNVEDAAHIIQERKLIERQENLRLKEDQLSKKEKEVYESQSSLEKKRIEWEQWRQQEEMKLHETLRNKESAMMSVIEERIASNEKERLVCLERSKSEYAKLESRLQKAIVEVEAKDRQLKEVRDCHEHEYKRKVAELELREKLVKQEMKSVVEIEQAKAKAALDQAVLAQKSEAAAAKKVKQVEDEMDALRVQHRNTPEAALTQQVAELKGQLADRERKIEVLKAERGHIIAEKEQFRMNVRKLVSPFES